MNITAAPTYTAAIYVAGDLAKAKEICRAHCFDAGLCVTVEPTLFIYTGGEEAGVRVGLINYPRFPAEPTDIFAKAQALGESLLAGLHQWSFAVVAPDQTVWFSRRPEDTTPP